jgi:hypothetical protein
MRPASAVPEHLLSILSFASNLGCLAPGAGNTYFVEAWGYVNDIKVCEVSQTLTNVWGSGVCPPSLFGAANKQRAVITVRNSNTRQWVASKAFDAAPKAWATPSVAAYTEPAHNGCPAIVVNLSTKGYDIP